MFGDSQVRFLLRRWKNGDSAVPIIERLMELGFRDEAGAMARLALAYPDCLDRETIQNLLHDIASSPDGWLDSLADFAQNPSLERWDVLNRFVPEDVFYQRLRDTIQTLMRLGCDGNMLFRCATKLGMTSDIFDLVKSGTVDPEVVEARGEDSAARPAWLGLAAQAAFARGDRFAVIRYLREASRDEEAGFLAWASITEIRDAADEELRAELDKVGVPKIVP